VVRRAASPSAEEAYCAWFGARAGDALYFGESAFWSAYRAGGDDPRASLPLEGPQHIGRMDLARERLLPPLDVTHPGARSGVWDVLAHPNGRVYFTSLFDPAGWVDPATGAHEHWEGLGTGLSELALASAGELVAARYARPGQRHGSVVRISPEGRLVAEHALAGPADVRVAPKSVAYDRLREETWVLSDLLAPDDDRAVEHDARAVEHDARAVGHDARVLGRDGRERLRIVRPEVQCVHFEPDGTGYLAEVADGALHLRILAPGDAEAPTRRGRRILLDAAFPTGLDFVQDLQLSDDGRVAATRWSGRVHVVGPEGVARTLRLPRLAEDGLYYTGVLREDRLCATWCSGVAVVCRDAPPGG